MQDIVLKGGKIVNEGASEYKDIWIKDSRIYKIADSINTPNGAIEIDCEGRIIMPGVIDDQVHFREPGLTHKADLATESMAAILGGTTTFMEMPNTNPPTFTINLLEQKYSRARKVSYANYSFFLGTSNDNLDEIKKLDPSVNCGVKIFMGSSTGNLLVDDYQTLENVFSNTPTLIATHCEDEATILSRKELFKEECNGLPNYHPIIRNHEACILSSQKAIEIAKKTNARLHILHISTAQEVDLFDNTKPLAEKKITSEACVHHLWFSTNDYATYGNQIVCNPAIKTQEDQKAVWNGLLNGKIDIIATDHAPHTQEEKAQLYPNCPSGVPLVQHSLLMMLEKLNDQFTIEVLVDKMCHAPATCYKIKERGYLREGYFADIAIILPNTPTLVTKNSLAYKCKWSPFEGFSFKNSVEYTILNGVVMQKKYKISNTINSQRLEFQ